MKHTRSSSLPYVLDEDEELLLDDSDKTLLKRYASSEAVFTLKGDVGEGSNNCAHFVHDEDGRRQVLRIALLPDLPTDLNTVRHNKKIVRGLEMVHAFQNYKSLLGPSLLKEESTYLLVKASELRKYVLGDICKKVMSYYEYVRKEQNYQDNKFNNQFALQHLEYLSGGEFDKQGNDNLALFYAFSLIWFLSMAQKAFGFRHHDLKASNIIFRRTNTLQQYTFELTDRQLYFHFESPIVPVIIDYDFATTTNATDALDRNAAGTEYSAPPDVLIRRLCKLIRWEYTLVQSETSYDWWGLGICLLEMLRPGVKYLFLKEGDWFANNFLKNFSFAPKSRIGESVYWAARALFFAYCLSSIFSRTGPFVRPPSDFYLYGRELFPDDSRVMRMDHNVDYVALKKWFEDLFRKHDWKAELLHRLLHWNPSERDNDGNPTQYLLDFEMLAEQQRRPGILYEFRANINQAPIPLEGYPLLAMQVCSFCQVGKPMFVCTCCKKLVCSRTCH